METIKTVHNFIFLGLFFPASKYLLGRTVERSVPFRHERSRIRDFEHICCPIRRILSKNIRSSLLVSLSIHKCLLDSFGHNCGRFVLVQVRTCYTFIQLSRLKCRIRILHKKYSMGRLRLLSIGCMLFIPHALHIASFLQTMSPRIELEPLIDQFFHEGYSRDFGLYGKELYFCSIRTV